MSDRVPFGTVQWDGVPPFATSFDPGRSSGFSGFPFPIGSGSESGILRTFAQAIELYWRINCWHIKGTLVVSYEYGGPQTVTVTVDDDLDYTLPFSGFPGIIRERSLIFGPAIVGGITTTWSTTAGPTPSGDAIVALNLFPSLSEPLLPSVDKYRLLRDPLDPTIYYVPFTLSVEYDAFNPSGIIAGGIAVSSALADDATFLFDGEERAIGAGGGPDYNPVVTSCSLEITRKRYWPYAARDGTPIYDTASGLRLQDPRA